MNLGTDFFPDGSVMETGSSRSLAAGLTVWLHFTTVSRKTLAWLGLPFPVYLSVASPYVFLARSPHFPHGGLGLPGAQE